MADSLELTTKIVTSHIARNSVDVERLPDLIRSVYAALSNAGKPEPETKAKEPAVPVKKSVFNDHIVCLECGKNLRVMKRHIETDHGLTVEEYRKRFGLPGDYPMVAPEYAARRSELAKEIGLGRHTQAKRGRKRA